jgi:hypothetical protein
MAAISPHTPIQRTPAPGGGRCDAASWSAPAPVPSGADGQHVARFPVLVSDNADAVVLGNDIVSYDGRPIPREPLTVWSLDGRNIGRPPGHFTFAYPRGAMRSGTLHMLWAEPSDSTRTSDPYAWPGELSSVWGASYSPRSGWSRPSRVFAGMLQAPLDGSPSVGATSDASLVEFGTHMQGYSAFILAFRLTDERWDSLLIPVGPGAFYPSVVQVDSTIVAAFVDAAGGRESDVNSLFLVRSTDGGRTWMPRLLLSRSGRRAAFDSQLLLDSHRQLHLVWRRMEADERGTIGHMMSPDGGRSWTHAEELTLAVPAYLARAGIDRCGQVHVLYADLSGREETSRIGHVRWNGTWHDDGQLFPTFELGGMTVHADTDAALTMVFLGRERDSTSAATSAPYRTLFSRFAP